MWRGCGEPAALSGTETLRRGVFRVKKLVLRPCCPGRDRTPDATPHMPPPFSFQALLPGLLFPSRAADKIRAFSSAMSLVAGLFPWYCPRKCGRRSQKIHKRIGVAMAMTRARLTWRSLQNGCVASIADKSTGNFLIQRGDSRECLTRDCHSFAKDFFCPFIAAMPAVYDFWGPAIVCGVSRLTDVHFHARNRR